MRKIIILATLLLSTAMWASAQAPEHPSPVDGSGVSLHHGLKYWDLKVGTGAEAKKGRTVKVHYTGWLLEKGTSSTARWTAASPLSSRSAQDR